jgi:hypothetical protein
MSMTPLFFSPNELCRDGDGSLPHFVEQVACLLEMVALVCRAPRVPKSTAGLEYQYYNDDHSSPHDIHSGRAAVGSDYDGSRNRSKPLDSFATPSADTQKEMQAKPGHQDTVFARDEELWMSRQPSQPNARTVRRRGTPGREPRRSRSCTRTSPHA